MEKGHDRGLVIVYTGDGKGKTTAALGLCLRAIGHGNKILVIQFLKSDWPYGELAGAKRLAPELEIRPLGVGCIGILGDDKPLEEHRQAAERAFEEVKTAVMSGEYDIVVLDEINIAVHFGLVAVDDVCSLVKARPESTTLVLTGRHADQRLIEIADLVTEMREIKHPYRQGISAMKGIDY
jgi:cob(I)alamin adenosyltransferase